jgi:UDP-N-acetylmuramoyl-tripeptide--D-alanyl-D-alanine ligase
VVGDAASAILTGTKAVPSWQGELLLVPGPAAAVTALRDRLRAGDVVLVKASHSVGLEQIALALTGERPGPGDAAGPAA